jgi:hypothetical protein
MAPRTVPLSFVSDVRRFTERPRLESLLENGRPLDTS